MLRKTTQILTLTLLLCLVSIGQEAGETVQNQDAKIPIKIDEFGLVGECELGSRLDSFFIELMNNSSATGYVINYQRKDVLPSEYESNLRERLIRNQIRFRNFDASRITFIRGGFRNQLATELFLVPNGAAAPEPTETVSAPTLSKDKTYLYDNNSLNTEYSYDTLEEFILPSVKAKIEEENRLAEEESKTDKPLSELELEEVKRWNEDFERRKLEAIEETKFDWINGKFGEIIKQQKDSQGVMIFYADDAYYDINKLQKRIEKGKQKIIETNKLPMKKIQVVYGGYRSEVQTEFWIVPKKGTAPTPKPEERPVEETKN